MTIRHKDRTGKPWAFELNCTPVQGRLVERLLEFVRCIGNREELTVTYLAEWEANTAFRNSMEYVVLSALREWDGTLIEPPKPLEEPPPPTPEPVTQTSTVPPTFSTNTHDDDDDGKPHYYWENF